MNPWATYSSRVEKHGGTLRNAALTRERRFLSNKMQSNLSYHNVLIDGHSRECAVINSDNLDTKTICSLPGEDIPHGGIVEWMGNFWLITARDANNEVYTRATMRQCNYNLRWVADDGKIIERWVIVEDGTKYLTGEYGDNHFILTRGDSRISVTMPIDEYTIKLNRKNRFLIDHYDSPSVIAYELTKPFKLGGNYTVGGVMTFVMQECNTEDSDNLDLHIANYYDHFPRENSDNISSLNATTNSNTSNSNGKKVWF